MVKRIIVVAVFIGLVIGLGIATSLIPIKAFNGGFANPHPTSLSLSFYSYSPYSKIIEVPYLELDDGSVLIFVELEIINVDDLKDYSFDFTYDTSILEIYNGGFVQMEDWFYNKVGGFSGSSLGGRLANTFQGSGIPFVYGFRVLQPGVTQLNLTNTKLFDVNGSIIPHTVSGITVEVLSLEEWVDGKYTELLEQYDSLNSSLSLLQEDYNELEGDYNHLNQDYDSLDAFYNELELEHTAIIDEINNIRNLMYIFIATTLLFIATTVYFARVR